MFECFYILCLQFSLTHRGCDLFFHCCCSVSLCKLPPSQIDRPLDESILSAMEEGTLPLSQIPKARRKNYMAKVLIAKVRMLALVSTSKLIISKLNSYLIYLYVIQLLYQQHVWVTNCKVRSETSRFERKASLLIEEVSTGEDEEEGLQMTRELQCAICLSRYKNGEKICFSQNEKCHHAFHKRCLEAWLAEHEECPCCRLPYVRQVQESSDRNGEDIEC